MAVTPAMRSPLVSRRDLIRLADTLISRRFFVPTLVVLAALFAFEVQLLDHLVDWVVDSGDPPKPASLVVGLFAGNFALFHLSRACRRKKRPWSRALVILLWIPCILSLLATVWLVPFGGLASILPLVAVLLTAVALLTKWSRLALISAGVVLTVILSSWGAILGHVVFTDEAYGYQPASCQTHRWSMPRLEPVSEVNPGARVLEWRLFDPLDPLGQDAEPHLWATENRSERVVQLSVVRGGQTVATRHLDGTLVAATEDDSGDFVVTTRAGTNALELTRLDAHLRPLNSRSYDVWSNVEANLYAMPSGYCLVAGPAYRFLDEDFSVSVGRTLLSIRTSNSEPPWHSFVVFVFWALIALYRSVRFRRRRKAGYEGVWCGEPEERVFESGGEAYHVRLPEGAAPPEKDTRGVLFGAPEGQSTGPYRSRTVLKATHWVAGSWDDIRARHDRTTQRILVIATGLLLALSPTVYELIFRS